MHNSFHNSLEMQLFQQNRPLLKCTGDILFYELIWHLIELLLPKDSWENFSPVLIHKIHGSLIQRLFCWISNSNQFIRLLYSLWLLANQQTSSYLGFLKWWKESDLSFWTVQMKSVWTILGWKSIHKQGFVEKSSWT